MLKSYEAVIENGQIKWLADQPQITSARVIVTILEEAERSEDNDLTLADLGGLEPQTQDIPRRRSPPAVLAGKVKILGDIVSPIVNEEDWKC